MRAQRPPRGGAWRGPQIPAKLLHPFQRIAVTKEFLQDEGGIYKTVSKVLCTFQGAIFPLSNEDMERLPEGTATINTQKLYTNGETVGVGQQVRDTLDDQVYTVITELTHSPVHGLKRYVVTGKGAAANG